MMTGTLAILASLFSLFGLGGLGLVGLGSIGIGGGLVAWFVARNIPWKLIGIVASVIAICLWATAGYHEFRVRQAELVQIKVDLAQEKLLRQYEKQRADNYFTEHANQIAKIEKLEKDNASLDEETNIQRDMINDMDLNQEFDSDASKAIAAFNARNAALNGLLDRASRGGHADGGKAAHGPDAGKAKSGSPLQRALQSLR